MKLSMNDFIGLNLSVKDAYFYVSVLSCSAAYLSDIDQDVSKRLLDFRKLIMDVLESYNS